MLISRTSCNINFPIKKNPLEKPKNNPSSRDIKKKFKIDMAKFKAPFDEKQFHTKIPKFKV
jgi:hypothetical protein